MALECPARGTGRQTTGGLPKGCRTSRTCYFSLALFPSAILLERQICYNLGHRVSPPLRHRPPTLFRGHPTASAAAAALLLVSRNPRAPCGRRVPASSLQANLFQKMATATAVCPGDRLKPAGQYAAGPGTYVSGGFVCSSVVGFESVADGAAEGGGSGGAALPVVTVSKRGAQSLVPEPGAVVIAKVTRVNQRMANCDILCVGSKALEGSFQGVIRIQDIRATEIDKVEVYSSFRPGDMVRAKVLSLGDARSYFLTTAENELGVVHAVSAAGAPMVAASWEQMECTKTKQVEARKVAKVT